MNPILNEQAQEIAAATGALLGRSILITDANAIIIGCTSPERIGEFHSPSLPVIAFGKETYDDEEAASKLGVLPGVTLPFTFFGNIVGSVAVAGKPEEVFPFALLVKKQAEMMLRERLYLKNRYKEDRSLTKLIDLIASFDPAEDVLSDLILHGKNAGFDLALPRVTIAFEIKRFRTSIPFNTKKNRISKIENEIADPLRSVLDAQIITKNILENIRSIFNADQDMCCALSKDEFVVLAVVQTNMLRDIHSMCKEVLSLTLKHNVELAAGVGTPAVETMDIISSYGEAWKALSLGSRTNQSGGLFDIMDLQLENMIASSAKRTLSKNLLKTLETILAKGGGEELTHSYQRWFESFFNLRKAASVLNIHRNTLYYRIDKLARDTGIDLSNFKQVTALYLAILSLNIRK